MKILIHEHIMQQWIFISVSRERHQILSLSYIMKDTKKVERSLWSRTGAGVDGHEVVRAKGGVVDVAVRESAMMLPA